MKMKFKYCNGMKKYQKMICSLAVFKKMDQEEEINVKKYRQATLDLYQRWPVGEDKLLQGFIVEGGQSSETKG